MMKFLTFLHLLVITLAGAKELEDYRLTLANACTPRNCTEAGPLCETCSKLVGCVEQPNGSWVKTPLATCSAPSYCVDGACTSSYDPFCWGTADLAFPCSKVGIFPDPFYRSKFVLCVKSGTTITAYVNSCELGFGFDIAHDLCSVPIENGECPSKDYPVPLCTRAGQSGAIPEKPAMFYICKERSVSASKTLLYPYLDVCPGGEVYVNYNCGGPTKPTTSPTTTSPS